VLARQALMCLYSTPLNWSLTLCLTRLRKDRCATLKLCLIPRQKYAGSRRTECNGPANASTDWLSYLHSRHSSRCTSLCMSHQTIDSTYHARPVCRNCSVVTTAYNMVVFMSFPCLKASLLCPNTLERADQYRTTGCNLRTCAPWRCCSGKTFSTADRPWASDNVPLLHQHPKPMWVSASKMLTCHREPLLCIANRCRSRH
jgi:hypothetical protein